MGVAVAHTFEYYDLAIYAAISAYVSQAPRSEPPFTRSGGQDDVSYTNLGRCIIRVKL